MKHALLSCLLSIFLWQAGNAQWNVNVTDAFCWGTCTGSAFVTPAGGNYHFYWNTGDTSQIVQGLCAGAYDLTVTDSADNPLDTILFFVMEPPALAITGQVVNTSCSGAQNGSVDVTVSGGTPPYTYNWNGGMATMNIGNLPGGTYNITVTDAHGCTTTASFTINEAPPLVITFIDSDATCAGNDGSLQAIVSGGTGTLNFLWSTGQTGSLATNLMQGFYTVTVVDANGCSALNAAFVSGGAGSPLSATVNNDTITCTHSAGLVSLVIANGTPQYNINWGDGSNQTSGTGSVNHTYPQPGVYTIVYSDSAACNKTVDVIIANAALTVNFNALNPGCNTPNSGSLTAAVTNGAPPYFYLWNTTATTNSINALNAGVYTLTVTDSTGCSVIQSYTLNTAASSISTYTQSTLASCVNGGTGTSTIFVSGGALPYTYAWSTTPAQTTQTATGLTPGAYPYTITDNAGCIVAGTAYVAYTSYSYYVYTNTVSLPNCGSANGSVTASASGGTQPYTYLWSNNQTTATATALDQGIYTVTVTDAGGCTAEAGGYLQSSCYNTITGKLYLDGNNNCSYDNGEQPVYYHTVKATKGAGVYYGYADLTGNYSIEVHDTGTFTVTSINNNYGVSCQPPCGAGTLTVSFSSYNNVSGNNNFGYTNTSGFDFFLHPGWIPANPGFDKSYWIFYGNHGGIPYTGPATVTFKYDSNLTYLSSDPPLPAHNAATHTLTWHVTGVSGWDRLGNCNFNVPASVPAGYYLQSDFYITPNVGDCDSTDNHEHFSELMTSSMDPNEKEVSPAGPIYEEDSVLTYTIHFQNTGTDTTWFIVLKDTLSSNLDPGSVRNLASSHEYSEFKISGSGILTWLFNPIFLVDSATNEPASKGFVKFSVKKKRDLPIGTAISNKADIYFDYNQPVTTNTVSSTLSDPTYIFEPRGNSQVKVEAFPNPFSESTNIVVTGLNEKFDFTLFDITGRREVLINSVENNRFMLSRDDLPAGVYFYKISTGKQQVAFGKLVVQ